MSHGTGLLEPFVSQIWISVKGGRWILGVGSCASDIGSGIGGGGGTEFYAGYNLVADRDDDYPF